MAYFRTDNTEGFDANDLKALNERFEDAIYLPNDALLAMSEIEIKSWHQHQAEMVLADYDAP